MKKFLLPLLAALVLTVGTATAQTTTTTDQTARPARDGRNHGDMAARQGERMTKELGLSADQQTRVQAIMQAQQQDMQAMRGQGQPTGTRDEMEARMKESRAKYDAQYKEVLTADQYTKYTQMQAERMKNGPGMGGPHGGKGMGPNDGKGPKTAKDGKVKVKKGKVKAKAND